MEKVNLVKSPRRCPNGDLRNTPTRIVTTYQPKEPAIASWRQGRQRVEETCTRHPDVETEKEAEEGDEVGVMESQD